MLSFLVETLLCAGKLFRPFPFVDFKGGRRAFKIFKCFISQNNRLLDNIIQEGLVVRNEHKSARLGTQEALKPDDCFKILFVDVL